MPSPDVVVRHEGSVCHVGGTLDFTTATQVLQDVSRIIEAEPNLTVDLGEVAHSNSAGLALLVEWLAVARRAEHELSFERVPDGLAQLARVCQVDSLI